MRRARVLSERKVGFRRILIANRGEIALRVLRACKEMGIGSVAVYAGKDHNPFLEYADEYVMLKGRNFSETYMDIKELIGIAKSRKADAIHPGYGFISESPDFAKACEEAGIVFIGPSSGTLRTVADKTNSKKVAKAVGMPVMRGSGPLLTSVEAEKYVCRNGYPVMIKSCVGGGGRGIRRINNRKELIANFDSAAREVASGFGNGAVFCERFIPGRHIEFQFLADSHGNVVHLFERECSVQRRFQKLVEEAPSTFLSAKLRERMGALVCEFARRVGYVGAGTVEFLVTNDREFYFLELNPRIQVEHGVTEMVTGVDIVREQIRIAQGLPLSVRQDGVSITGHAIECRIVTECPRRNFSPQEGVLRKISFPSRVNPGAKLRIDSAAHDFMPVGVYDSLLAKMIAWGATRDDALSAMDSALADTCVEGIPSTVEFLRFLLADRAFVSGKLSTRFIDDRNIVERFIRSSLTPEKVALIAAMIYDRERRNRVSEGLISRWIRSSRQEAVDHDI